MMSRDICVEIIPMILEREIKLFLSSIDGINWSLQSDNKSSIDSSIDNSKKKIQDPYWLMKYNYLTLLNLPQTMKEYGPLVNLWEGSNQGKGYLRYTRPYTRPIIINIHSKNWQVNTILKVQNKKSLDDVVDHHTCNCWKGKDVTNYYFSTKRNRVPKMYVKYKTINEVFTILRRNLPFSCVKTDMNW